jgi:hypothetical protein
MRLEVVIDCVDVLKQRVDGAIATPLTDPAAEFQAKRLPAASRSSPSSAAWS